MKDGGPAFPARVLSGRHIEVIDGRNVSVNDYEPAEGMSLRDWFAGRALSAQYAQCDTDPDKTAKWAFQIADSMLAKREKG